MPTAERLPNFLFLGPDRSGSTWLHAALSRHPQVYLSEAKDLYFFERYFHRGVDWYASQFRKARRHHEIIGEICPTYLYAPQAADRIHRTLPNARLMICVRDPVRRAFSSYLYLRRNGRRLKSFSKALESVPRLIERGRYATYLQPYLERFGTDRIYVGVFDDLHADPQGYLDDITAWLGLRPIRLPRELLSPKLPAGRPRSRKVAKFANHGALWARERGLTATIGRIKGSTAVQRLLYRPLGTDDHPKLKKRDADRVRAELDPEIRKLEQIYGLDLRRRWGWPS